MEEKTEMTLDQLLAVEVPDFVEQQQNILDALDSISTSPDVPYFFTNFTAKPAAVQLRAWLVSFPENMQETIRRLEGTLRARVCFAENGMKLLLAFREAVLYNDRVLTKFIDDESQQQTSTSIMQFVRKGQGTKRAMEREEPRPDVQIEVAKARRVRQLLNNVLNETMRQETASPFFLLYEWFSILTDVVPVRYKSIDTVLTLENVALLRAAL